MLANLRRRRPLSTTTSTAFIVLYLTASTSFAGVLWGQLKWSVVTAEGTPSRSGEGLVCGELSCGVGGCYPIGTT